MTLPLKASRPGRSEMSHANGMLANPNSDYQTARSGLPGPLSVPGEDKNDRLGRVYAERRSDPTNGEESIYPDLLYATGNPDQFGPGQPLVGDAAQYPPAASAQPVYRTGVTRQG